jgi:fatty acid-binding protein DegV
VDAKKLIELRKEAEKAVADMPDGDLKVKAFEVLLIHLVSNVDSSVSAAPVAGKASDVVAKKADDAPASSVAGRLLVLRAESFFKVPKALAEIREELKAHAWHYSNATIATSLIKLVQKGKLRRIRVQVGKIKGWKYSNP